MVCAVVEPRFQRTIMLRAVVEPRFQRTRMHCALPQFKTKREPRSPNVRSSTLSSCFFEIFYTVILLHAGGREFDSGRTNTQGLKITEQKVLPL